MKVLLATDGSSHARLAETVVSKIPRVRDGEVLVATISMPPALGMASLGPPGDVGYAAETSQAWDIVRDHSNQVLEGARERFAAAGLNVRTVMLEGETANELLSLAEEEQVDLIAVGSRGMGAMKSFFLGSVARRLINHAPVDVLVARAPEGTDHDDYARALRAKDKLSVMLCFDGSEGARLALKWVDDQGEGAFARAVCVCAEPLTVLPPGVDPSVFGSTYEYDHERAQALAKEAADSLTSCAGSCEHRTVLGRPADVLCEAAKEEEIDLIAIGATRHGFVERFLLGSVSYEVATHAPCSVVVVRPREEPR